MVKNLVIVLIIGIASIVVWGLLLDSDTVTVIIDGQQVHGPMGGIIGIGSSLVVVISLICAATLLVFFFAGFGLVVLGAFVFFGVIVAGFMFPFAFPVLVPLLIVWVFVALVQSRKAG